MSIKIHWVIPSGLRRESLFLIYESPELPLVHTHHDPWGQSKEGNEGYIEEIVGISGFCT